MIAQLLRKYAKKVPVKVLLPLANWWSPFRGAGIKVISVSPDYREVRVQMKLRWFNRNYVGTHFGGSLYAMTDPFYMLMLINNLGSQYIVWDKGASINFIKPGRGTVNANFKFTGEEISAIKSKADEQGKYVFDRAVNIVDDSGALVASVVKTLYVRSRVKTSART